METKRKRKWRIKYHIDTLVPIMGLKTLQRAHKITLRGNEVINGGWERIKKHVSSAQNDADIF